MICPKCNANVPDSMKFCTRCGSEVSPTVSYADIPLGTLVACPNCGTKNFRTDNKCRNCDLDLAPARAALAKGVQVEPEKFKAKCPNCGTDNPIGSSYCGNCRWSLLGQPAPIAGIEQEPFRLEGWMVALFYIVSFFVPVAGVVLGAVLVTSSKHSKSEYGETGKVCLILAVVSLVLFALIGLLLLMAGMLTIGSSSGY
jgi:DNA-directed RNA polymerase subunit RPC12/RpoP